MVFWYTAIQKTVNLYILSSQENTLCFRKKSFCLVSSVQFGVTHKNARSESDIILYVLQ